MILAVYPSMNDNTHKGEPNMRKVELEISATDVRDHYLASAIIDGQKKPAHEMILGANGELRTSGGNPARYFAPDDQLWWLAFAIEGAKSIRITGELKSA